MLYDFVLIKKKYIRNIYTIYWNITAMSFITTNVSVHDDLIFKVILLMHLFFWIVLYVGHFCPLMYNI